MFPLSKEEEDFPLAYSIVVHHKVTYGGLFIINFKPKSMHTVTYILLAICTDPEL